MIKVQKPINSECYNPLSERFRNYPYSSMINSAPITYLIIASVYCIVENVTLKTQLELQQCVQA
jgi:hypothetical protein